MEDDEDFEEVCITSKYQSICDQQLISLHYIITL